MRIVNLHDQLLAYTIKMSHINYVKKVHCMDTYIEFSNKGVPLPLAFIGYEGNENIYITFLDSFPSSIKKMIVHTTNEPMSTNTLVVCSIHYTFGILIIRNIITESESLEIPAYSVQKTMYSLPV